MITLFIDTAYNNMMIAVVKDNSILSLKEGMLDTKLSSLLVPYLKEVVDTANIKPSDIDNIMIVTGPGSFTGVRMGVTVAKTYAWALNKKIIPISSLEVMATSVDNDYIVPIIDARHDKVYAGIYDNNLNTILTDRHVLLSDLLKEIPSGATIVTDDSFNIEINSIKNKPDLIKVISKHINDQGVNPHTLNPNYLKRTEAEENLNKGEKYD